MAQSPEKLDPNFNAVEVKDTVTWRDARDLTLVGQGWRETSEDYCRLPDKAQGVVRDPVWELSRCSSGLHVDFTTDARTISVRWSLRYDALGATHMPATGVSGLDLYGRSERGVWRWAGMGRPDAFPTNETNLVENIAAGQRAYRLYLPIYNAPLSLEIGVPAGASIEPAPEFTAGRKPIVYYGSSILQGGCASRPGMAYPSILGRWLDWPGINLGFSANGRAEPEVALLLAELDAEIFVIDCLPNLTTPDVTERVGPFIQTIRTARPNTPIVLVENIEYQYGWLQAPDERQHDLKNAALQNVYKELADHGVGNLHYVRGDDLLGHDGEGTVDGTHPTDVGFLHMASALEPLLRSLLPTG